MKLHGYSEANTHVHVHMDHLTIIIKISDLPNDQLNHIKSITCTMYTYIHAHYRIYCCMCIVHV